MVLTTPWADVFSAVDIQKLEWSTIASAIAFSEKTKAFLLLIGFTIHETNTVLHSFGMETDEPFQLG